MTNKQFTDMLGAMGGDKKTLERLYRKGSKGEKKEKNKTGKFVVKTKLGYFLQDTDNTSSQIVYNLCDACIFTNFDDAKAKAVKHNGKVVSK